MTQFPCSNPKCNHPFEAIPPNSNHTQAQTRECVVNGSNLLLCNEIKEYECENCNHVNIIYWHQKKGHDKQLLKKAITILGDDFSMSNADWVEYD